MSKKVLCYWSQLVLGDVLGEGAFGRVVSATAHGICGQSGPTTVAIKMLKEACNDADVIDLVKAFDIMGLICHV